MVFIQELLHCLAKAQKKKLLYLQFLLLAIAILELVGVASVIPYLSILANPALINDNPVISNFYKMVGSDSLNNFMLMMGGGVLILVIFSGLFSILGMRLITRYSQYIGQEFSVRLYNFYLRQPYLFHAENNSAELMAKITQEANRITFHVLYPLLQINAKLISAVIILSGLFVIDPLLALASALIFGIAYLLIYTLVKTRLSNNGKSITVENKRRFKAMSEGFGGIKDIILLNKKEHYGAIFSDSSFNLAKVTANNQVISAIPRYFLEILAFGSILSLTLYHVFNNGDFKAVIPVLSLYAIAGFKLLPAFQQIYGGVANIKAGMSAFNSLKSQLIVAKQGGNNKGIALEKDFCLGDIEVKNVSFSYPSSSTYVLEDLNLTIPKNKTIGLAGPSGSGKTTTIDIILGLIEPESGCVSVGNVNVNLTNIDLWRQCIGYVPQTIFLSDATIAENIAFGVEKHLISMEKVNEALRMANLFEFVCSQPDGVHTLVGERGAQLSGGQMQRVGIARALYNDASVLILDEATSALDGITESEVMKAIANLSHHKTIIIIAHRLSTLKSCDSIMLFDKGRVVDHASFDQLMKSSNVFQRMANA